MECNPIRENLITTCKKYKWRITSAVAVGVIILVTLIVYVALKGSSNIMPGMDIIPKLNGQNADSILIRYKGQNYTTWTNQLVKSLEEYQRPDVGRQYCDYNKPPGSRQVCTVNISDWNLCISKNRYNYGSSAPCIFLKFNKVHSWIPEYYNNSKDLPENMPDDLKQHIREIEENNPKEVIILNI